MELHGLSQGGRPIDNVERAGIRSRCPFIPEGGVIGICERAVEAVKSPTSRQVSLIFSQAPHEVAHAIAAPGMAGDDEFADLKQRRRFHVRAPELRNGGENFIEVALTPFGRRQIIDTVIAGIAVTHRIFKSQEWRDTHHVLARIANLLAYSCAVAVE